MPFICRHGEKGDGGEREQRNVESKEWQGGGRGRGRGQALRHAARSMPQPGALAALPASSRSRSCVFLPTFLPFTHLLALSYTHRRSHIIDCAVKRHAYNPLCKLTMSDQRRPPQYGLAMSMQDWHMLDRIYSTSPAAFETLLKPDRDSGLLTDSDFKSLQTEMFWINRAMRRYRAVSLPAACISATHPP